MGNNGADTGGYRKKESEATGILGQQSFFQIPAEQEKCNTGRETGWKSTKSVHSSEPWKYSKTGESCVSGIPSEHFAVFALKMKTRWSLDNVHMCKGSTDRYTSRSFLAFSFFSSRDLFQLQGLFSSRALLPSPETSSCACALLFPWSLLAFCTFLVTASVLPIQSILLRISLLMWFLLLSQALLFSRDLFYSHTLSFLAWSLDLSFASSRVISILGSFAVLTWFLLFS